MNNKEIIRDIFFKNIGTVLKDSDDNLEFNSIDGWDSLKHVQFILDLEARLDFSFEASELESGNTVDNILNIVNGKI